MKIAKIHENQLESLKMDSDFEPPLGRKREEHLLGLQRTMKKSQKKGTRKPNESGKNDRVQLD